MKISEIYVSIQGEGKLTGVPSIFVRTSGCNLRCVWCDSPYTSWKPQGNSVSVRGIVETVQRFTAHHVVLTGGEPLIAADVTELTARLHDAGYHITLETAATVWRHVTCDLASISPKLSNSTPTARERGRFAPAHEKTRINIDTIRRLMNLADYQLKFVVSQPRDVLEIDEILTKLGHVQASNVLLMPEGVTDEVLAERQGWITQVCLERGFRYCPRLHIAMFGNKRGT
jgi:7-carboxy-7-deazaguanine synthase